MKVQFPPFEPDKASYNLAAASDTINALPVMDGWGPLPSITEISEALPADCTGYFFARSATGTTKTFAATATKLYLLNNTTLDWDDATRLSGGDYSSVSRWSFTQFGSLVIATNGTDEVQVFDIVSDTNFADLAGTPPVAKYVVTVGDFIVLIGLDGEPDTIHWSGINNAEDWVVGGEGGSDKQVMPAGGDILNALPASNGAVIYLRQAMRMMNFALSSGFVFTFNDITLSRGLAAPQAAAQIGQDDFIYYSVDGFWRGSTPIGAERVDRWFNAFIDTTYLDDLQASVDPYRKICWFRFRAIDSAYYLLGYNWQLDRWCLSDMQFLFLSTALTPSITIDGMDDYFPTIDDIDVPYDSQFFEAGAFVAGGITSDGKLGFISGDATAATIYTAQYSPNDPNRFYVNAGRLKGDVVNFTVEHGVADYEGQTLTYKPAVTPSSRTRFLGLSGDGRVHRDKLNIPAGESWKTVTLIDIQGTVAGS